MAATDETTELLDVRQAAALLDRHPETIRRWIWSGKLQARRSGNRLLIDRDDLRVASGDAAPKMTLAEWAEKARRVRGPKVERPEWDTADVIREEREARAERILGIADS